jgi:XTP/dITP diphosphohydrolase
MKLLFATTNRGKLAELSALISGLPIQVLPLRDVRPLEIEEDADTFAANACMKAESYASSLHIPVLADDSGLCVDALGGAPGVLSARFAGVGGEAALASSEERDRANNVKLLRELADVPWEKRTAAFRCAICLAVQGRESIVVEGECRGRILLNARGEQGFGYDPLFEVDGLGRTLAELASSEKNRISHRARAFAAIRPHLERLAAMGD